MSDIKINFAGIEEGVSSLNSKMSEYSSLLSNASGITKTITSEWEGNAAKSWESLMDGYLKKSTSLIDALRAYMEYAKSVASDFQALDQECANAINNSF